MRFVDPAVPTPATSIGRRFNSVDDLVVPITFAPRRCRSRAARQPGSGPRVHDLGGVHSATLFRRADSGDSRGHWWRPGPHVAPAASHRAAMMAAREQDPADVESADWRLRETAIHEAGHVVYAMAIGMGVESATIEPWQFERRVRWRLRSCALPAVAALVALFGGTTATQRSIGRGAPSCPCPYAPTTWSLGLVRAVKAKGSTYGGPPAGGRICKDGIPEPTGVEVPKVGECVILQSQGEVLRLRSNGPPTASSSPRGGNIVHPLSIYYSEIHRNQGHSLDCRTHSDQHKRIPRD